MAISDFTVDGFLNSLERAMDVASSRHELLSSNVANVDTPGYSAVDLDFDAAMKQALRRDSSGGAAAAMAALKEVEGMPVRQDGNNVSIEREMLALGSTRHRYSVAVELANLRIKQLIAATSGGRG